MYAVVSRTRSLIILAGLGLCACGSESARDELTPDAQAPDVDAPGPADNPLDAFSSATKELFHLVHNGTAEGLPRVFYVPKVMYLEARNDAPSISVLILSNPTTQERRYQMGSSFAWSSPAAIEQIEQLQREAASGKISVIRADVMLQHVACGLSDTLLVPTFFQRCDDAPRQSSFGFVAWQATQPREVPFETAKAAIDRHLADGSAWDDLIAGDIAWHIPGGGVLHTKLEVSCIGQLFDASGTPAVKLFDSPTCRARYIRP